MAYKDKLDHVVVANLEQLATYIEDEADPDKFAMGSYIHVPVELLEYKPYPRNAIQSYNLCGTVACLAGHGPIAGIAPQIGEGWTDYTYRAFISRGKEGFTFLFGGDWERWDNTLEGGAARIRYYLEHGPTDGTMADAIPLYQPYIKKRNVVNELASPEE